MYLIFLKGSSKIFKCFFNIWFVCILELLVFIGSIGGICFGGIIVLVFVI